MKGHSEIKCTMQILIRNIGEAFLVFDCVFDVPLKNDVYINKFQHSYMI